VVDVPFVDSLPSLLPRLPPLTTRYVMTLKESSGSVHPQSSSVFFSSHESHIFCHFMGYHFASYTEMQRHLVCYLYILEAGIHTRFPLLKACAGKNEKNERESENKL